MAGPINENTWVSLGFSLLFIGGGAAWMSRQEVITDAHTARIEEVSRLAEGIKDSLNAIDRRLFGIEQLLRRRSERK